MPGIVWALLIQPKFAAPGFTEAMVQKRRKTCLIMSSHTPRKVVMTWVTILSAMSYGSAKVEML